MTQKAKPKSNPRSGISLALTAFIVSIVLYFQPGYFGFLTNAVAIFLIALGFAGLGIDLERLVKEGDTPSSDGPSTSGIFNNIGIGVALIIIWAAVFRYFPFVWLNIFTVFFLLFGVYGTTLGLVNLLFGFLAESRSNPEHRPTIASQLQASETKQPWSVATKIAVAVAGTTAFVASLLQILQIIKVIP